MPGDILCPVKKNKKCVYNFVPRHGHSVPRPGHSVPGHSVPRTFCAHTIDYVVQKSEFLNFLNDPKYCSIDYRMHGKLMMI